MVTVAEINFLLGGVDQALGGNVFATNNLGGFIPANAFDKNPATLWASANTNLYPYHIGFDFGVDTLIDGLTIKARADGFVGGNLLHVVVQYSADNVNWFTAYSVLNEPPWVAGEQRTYNFVEVSIQSLKIIENYRISDFKAIPFSSYFIQKRDQ